MYHYIFYKKFILESRNTQTNQFVLYVAWIFSVHIHFIEVYTEITLRFLYIHTHVFLYEKYETKQNQKSKFSNPND